MHLLGKVILTVFASPILSPPLTDAQMQAAAHVLTSSRCLGTHQGSSFFIPLILPKRRQRFVYVSLDACMASQLVTLRVVQQLQVNVTGNGKDTTTLGANHLLHSVVS